MSKRQIKMQVLPVEACKGHQCLSNGLRETWSLTGSSPVHGSRVLMANMSGAAKGRIQGEIKGSSGYGFGW